MSLNLKKHETEILNAWKKVTENEESYDWALFGYEGKTFALKVEAIGSGGIEAIAEEFNDGKIQYGFVRILDPNTHLNKFLLINFQGEAVLDLVHKGSCANHIHDITKLLKNHLTITVTNIDDLDEDIIIKKLSKITSAYNFENRTVPNDEKFVIGTNYSKVVPTKEIDSVKRDAFWKKEEEVEKARVNAELEAKRLENLKIEEERLKREQREHLKREQLNKELEKKKATTTTASREEIKAISSMKKEELPAKPRAEELRNERRKEAQELIGNKVNTAKLMFQQQAAQSASKATVASSATSHGPPAKPIRKTIHKIEPEPIPVQAAVGEEEKIEEIQPQQQQQQHPEQNEEEEYFSTIKRSPKTPTTPTADNTVFIINNDNIDNGNVVADNNGHAKIEEKEEIQTPLQQQHQQQQQQEEQQQVVESNSIEEDESDQHLLKAVALYDYQAADETEISFDPGDLITHIDCIDPGWWQGFAVRFGTYGLFPANYVQLIDEIPPQSSE